MRPDPLAPISNPDGEALALVIRRTIFQRDGSTLRPHVMIPGRGRVGLSQEQIAAWLLFIDASDDLAACWWTGSLSLAEITSLRGQEPIPVIVWRGSDLELSAWRMSPNEIIQSVSIGGEGPTVLLPLEEPSWMIWAPPSASQVQLYSLDDLDGATTVDSSV
jgi:hypothetical protein